mgnify:CR=1 FL=1
MAMAALWQPHQTGQEPLEHGVASRLFGAGFDIGGGLFVLTFASTRNFGNSFRGVEHGTLDNRLASFDPGQVEGQEVLDDVALHVAAAVDGLGGVQEGFFGGVDFGAVQQLEVVRVALGFGQEQGAVVRFVLGHLNNFSHGGIFLTLNVERYCPIDFFKNQNQLMSKLIKIFKKKKKKKLKKKII